MPLYSARPPETPPMTLSVRLRRGGGRSGGPAGGWWAIAGGSGDGGAGGGVEVMAPSLAPRDRAVHQGGPPSDPGPRPRVLPGAAERRPGATIGTVTTTLPVPVRPPLVRPRSGRLVAGVAAGTALHLGADTLIVRVVFVVLAATGIGAVPYLLLWFFMPVADVDADPVAPEATEPPSRRQAVGLGLVGVALATAPLWRRLLASREAERTARIRSEERAAVAAHLHDSVLQTLALIQRHAEDPTALGAATREALVNVAKHSGAAVADLYTEVSPQRVAVFVRDRGAGFDPAAVPGDRRGLRDSVTGRLTRLGGTATVRSAPGEGTEVELFLPREAA